VSSGFWAALAVTFMTCLTALMLAAMWMSEQAARRDFMREVLKAGGDPAELMRRNAGLS
jgi:hypothetical protein